MDTNGLILAVRVHGADLPDRDGGRQLLAEDLQRELPRLEMVWADGAYTRGFREWAQDERGWRVEVPYHRDRQLWRYGLWRRSHAGSGCCRGGGWSREPSRGWGRRKLAKDYERLPETAVAMIYWAMSRIMLRRLARATC